MMLRLLVDSDRKKTCACCRQSSGAGGGFRLPHRKKVLTVVGVAVFGFLIGKALKVHQQHLCKVAAWMILAS